MGVFGDRYRLALQVGAVGWSCRLRLWIRVGQSNGSEVLAGDVGQRCWLELLFGATGHSC